MIWVGKLVGHARRVILGVPGLRVIALAIRSYIRHQSANQAGSVAFSTVLSMFPLLLLVSAGAAYIGSPGDAAALVGRVIGYAPPLVRTALQPVINQVLAERNERLLAIGILVTVWTASSGMQAVRTALNRAYGVERGVAFWKARIKVTLFTVTVGAAILVTFSSVIVMPYVWQLLANNVDAEEAAWLRSGIRYGSAFVVVSVLYALLYGWLPDIPQRLRTVVPGALLGGALWVGAAAMLSYTLRGAGKLVLIYGSFAGVVATLVFLYVSATTMIFGAEVNAVLRDGAPKADDEAAADAAPAADSPSEPSA